MPGRSGRPGAPPCHTSTEPAVGAAHGDLRGACRPTSGQAPRARQQPGTRRPARCLGRHRSSRLRPSSAPMPPWSHRRRAGPRCRRQARDIAAERVPAPAARTHAERPDQRPRPDSDSRHRVGWHSVVGICRYSPRRGQGPAREEPSWLSSQDSPNTREPQGMSHMAPSSGSTSASRRSLRAAHKSGSQRRQPLRARRSAMTRRASAAAEPTTAPRARICQPAASLAAPPACVLPGSHVDLTRPVPQRLRRAAQLPRELRDNAPAAERGRVGLRPSSTSFAARSTWSLRATPICSSRPRCAGAPPGRSLRVVANLFGIIRAG